MSQPKELSILIIDDEYEYREVLKDIIHINGYVAETAESGEAGLRMISEKDYDVVLTDLLMAGIDGIQFLERAKLSNPKLEIIIITGYGTVHNAVKAMRKGAFGYFVKSHDPEELILELEKIEKIKHLEKDNLILRAQQGNPEFLLNSQNERFNQVLTIARKVAENDSNVLIIGESGVGKEVVARYIHQCRLNGAGAFITVDCNSLPDSLLESELYGYIKGAFTGAQEFRKGRFEAAHNGILFIDEIGDLPESTQVKLLRNLESKEIYRLGSSKAVKVNFKLISATNKDLAKAIQSGVFREDLFYRISTITIEVPPLRERPEDIEQLILHFIRKMELNLNREVKKIEPGLYEFLLHYNYPGNIRELRNIIERLIVLSDDGILRKCDLPSNRSADGGRGADSSFMSRTANPLCEVKPLRDVRRATEADYIGKVLELCGHNVSEAARRLDISRRQLSNKINELRL